MVKKKNGKWRICMDFTDLNKACPKDSFSLPHIDQLIDAIAGHELLSFLDAYSGYNQILMEEEDQEKTIFITHQGMYCYMVIPFGLKNTRATYQRFKASTHVRGKRLKLRCDSQLVVNQITGTFQIKEHRLQKYHTKIYKLMPEFDEYQLDQIPRPQNTEEDGLAKLAAATKNIATGDKSVIHLLNSSLDHVEDDILPDDKKEAKKLRMQVARYSVIHNDLYKRTYGGPLEKCLRPNQMQHVLEEVHEGHCGAHSGNRALWVEAGAFAQIREHEVITFIWKNMICRFGLPKEINCDNEPRFTGKRVAEFFEKWHIKRILSTPYHPTRNRQAESSNKSILNITKKKLEDAKGQWPKILPEVLWAYRTTPKTSTGETPYSLVYETDAVIPIEVREPSLRYSHESGPRNDESRRHELDEAEERRDMAYIRMIVQKQQAECYYNKKAKVRHSKSGTTYSKLIHKQVETHDREN
ncbi:uncharacterized protein [Nicotiana tomentosiformis]|uniref:uncharacterized protein n=1 Tax=Nicotiana tomentosiformis TaxID=4098 RepID=UPI00388CD279